MDIRSSKLAVDSPAPRLRRTGNGSVGRRKACRTEGNLI